MVVSTRAAVRGCRELHVGNTTGITRLRLVCACVQFLWVLVRSDLVQMIWESVLCCAHVLLSFPDCQELTQDLTEVLFRSRFMVWQGLPNFLVRWSAWVRRTCLLCLMGLVG